MKLFSKKNISILLVILLLAVLLVAAWRVWQSTGMSSRAVDIQTPVVGVRGPLVIRFDSPVDQVSAQKNISFDPALVGIYDWVGDTAFFWPVEPLKVGQTYTIRVAPGVITADNRTIQKEVSWQVQVRPPQVVYLSPSRNPELWRMNPEDGASTQLTETGGRIYDYAVAPDGEKLIYSRFNDLGGVSLWSINRDGGEASLLLDCGEDWCINPAVAPDDRRMAYARKQAGISEGSSPGLPQIWTYDFASQETDRLYANPIISGMEPSWSPDGRFLVFFDGNVNGLRLINFETHQDNVLPSDAGMSARWSPNGLEMYFNNIVVDGTSAYSQVYRYNLPTGQVSPAFNADQAPLDYSPVAFSTNPGWLVVGIREITGNPVQQMWLMRSNGSDRQAVTEDPLVNTGAYSWSPAGEQVVYQALNAGSSSAAPQIMLWDRATGKVKLLAEDANRPGWIP